MEVAVKRKAKRRHLNAQECGELGQSAPGTNVLTQPHTSSKERGNRDPNWGLYPRTPTKRQRYGDRAPAAGSPSGHQRSINSFFSVSRIIRSSPNKSSSPSTSTCCNGRSNILQEEEEDEEDEEDDDISLLAVPLPPEIRGKSGEEIDDNLLAAVMNPEFDTMDEDEIEDASLLGVAMGLESDAGGETDYLEGVTAEMFGADSDFDRCGVQSEEEEVEPLPDEHYGLLGSSRALLRPQGCVDDLPEEILRQILCLVPAQDLYRCVSLVCHRWRDIVLDTTFVPFKKQYYRYLMREKDAVGEMSNILKNSGIANPTLVQDSIRNLVILMAEHKVGERVRPDDVLERVKKHRLFPQAEASIRLRIKALDGQSLNPFAAMAVILILSESVADVQALVSLLTGRVSLSAITEYLNHVAMMLLALKRNNIQISNRPHYNIYYVLHLMENGPFSVSGVEGGNNQIRLTREQQRILSHDIQRDHVVKIIAFAGTGKTTTLVKYAEQRPHLRFLYVAFNNSVVTAARRCFPSNVDCRTVHSLAYSDIGKSYRDANKLTFNLKPYNINFVQPKGRGGFVNSKVIASTLNAFMASADPTINARHVLFPLDNAANAGDAANDVNRDGDKWKTNSFVEDALNIWNKMKDLKETSQQAYYMTHDGYLKLWQLQIPKPRLSDKYDAMFIDEAQDCNPAIMDVLLSQRCGKILVGDPHQQIYTFRGAVNALNVTPHTHVYYLTQSFRFGAEIAYVGATILSVCKRVDKILVGGKQKGGVCDETADRAIEAVRTGVSPSPGTTAILSRCNLGVFSGAVCLIDANPNCRLHFIGDVKNIGLDKILDLYYLLQHAGKKSHPGQQLKYFKDPLIRFFAKKNIEKAFSVLKQYAEQTEDKELEGKLAIVEKYRGRIPELVNRLNGCYESEITRADFIVGTVHKAKGLEFHTVIVNDDFVKVPSSSHDLCHYRGFAFSKIPADEWNLLYVAVTRAKTSLVITKNIKRILTVAGEYLLKSEMPPSPLTIGNTPPCSVGNCPNCITPGSAFIMRKPPMKYSDCESDGGPLCERCVWTRVGPAAFLMTDDVLSMAEIPQRFHRLLHDFIVAFI